MNNIRSEFMFNQSKKEFEELSQRVKEKIIINYVRNGVSMNTTGTLTKVLPFKGIEYSGGFLPFVSKEILIRKIITDDNIIVYDREFMIGQQAKVLGNLRKYKVAILGSTSGTKNEYVDNLRQDL
ncbi:MAG: hypothetical protein PHQ62_01140 [Clostridia bacterium]|nr:hypothetical protein [Clostridia bacterium]